MFFLVYVVDFSNNTYVHLRTVNFYVDGTVARDYTRPRSQVKWEKIKNGSRIDSLARVLRQYLSRNDMTLGMSQEDDDFVRRDTQMRSEVREALIAEEHFTGKVVNSGELTPILSYGRSLKKIRGNKVNLRVEPDRRAKILTQLNNGVPVVAEATWDDWTSNEAWYYVKTDNSIKGWVFSKYIQDR